MIMVFYASHITTVKLTKDETTEKMSRLIALGAWRGVSPNGYFERNIPSQSDTRRLQLTAHVRFLHPTCVLLSSTGNRQIIHTRIGSVVLTVIVSQALFEFCFQSVSQGGRADLNVGNDHRVVQIYLHIFKLLDF